MKGYRLRKVKLIYIKLLLAMYKITKNMLPKFSMKLKTYIEKVSLYEMNHLKQVLSDINK